MWCGIIDQIRQAYLHIRANQNIRMSIIIRNMHAYIIQSFLRWHGGTGMEAYFAIEMAFAAKHAPAAFDVGRTRIVYCVIRGAPR